MGKLNPFWVNALLAVLMGLSLIQVGASLPVLLHRMTDVTGQLLYWPEKPALELRVLAQAASNWVLERATLQEQARELQKENLLLRAVLQRMGKPAPKAEARLVPAKVTFRHPEAWWKEFRVDRGSRQGVRVGAPALSEGYLVGKVSRVGDNYAWIELVTSSSFLIAAVVDETWDLGVVTGDDQGNIWLLYIPEEKKFKKSMRVSTALIGDYLPPGIPIGKVWGGGEARGGFLPRKIGSGAHLTQLYGVQIYVSEGVGP